jgi:hypothetical protein
MQEAVHRSCEFQLSDLAVYYFNAINRMSSPSYHPTEQDILRSCEEDGNHGDDVQGRKVDAYVI